MGVTKSDIDLVSRAQYNIMGIQIIKNREIKGYGQISEGRESLWYIYFYTVQVCLMSQSWDNVTKHY